MRSSTHSWRVSRRKFLCSAVAAAALTSRLGTQNRPAALSSTSQPPSLLTPALEFRNVSRGNPKPYTLQSDDLIRARVPSETWRLKITADDRPHPAISERARFGKPLTLADGTAPLHPFYG